MKIREYTHTHTNKKAKEKYWDEIFSKTLSMCQEGIIILSLTYPIFFYQHWECTVQLFSSTSKWKEEYLFRIKFLEWYSPHVYWVRHQVLAHTQ